ncbi:MAG: hypothetical protein ACYCYR_13160 [Desulfobulbaceae bacterium]|jgi:hypothetical protein
MPSSEPAQPPKITLDYTLLLATVGVLFALSVLCVYGMFAFKFAAVHQMAPAAKLAYLARMNAAVSPFIVALILLLGICVPKRLLPIRHLSWFSGFLALAWVALSVFFGIRTGLLAVLGASLLLQFLVLGMAVAGSERLNFARSGYWLRVGSSLIHLGLIAFVLDLLLHRQQGLHLFLFWLTTGTTVLGMLCCFYAADLFNYLRGRGRKAGEGAGLP